MRIEHPTADRPSVATVDIMEVRLQAWASWLRAGRQGEGYPTKSVLHQSWMPPAPGMQPGMRMSTGSDHQERALHRAIQALSVRLQNTLVVVYLMRASVDEQVMRLDCQPSTVRARVAEAKRVLGVGW